MLLSGLCSLEESGRTKGLESDLVQLLSLLMMEGSVWCGHLTGRSCLPYENCRQKYLRTDPLVY